MTSSLINSSRGLDAWHQYYSKLFGSRWDNLYKCLLMKNRQVAFMNPFFKRFPLQPQLFHPQAEWCSDPELDSCIHIQTQNDDKSEVPSMFDNLLHPSMFRMKKDANAWIRDKEFKNDDQYWYNTSPDKTCTYYEHFDHQKFPEFSKWKHLKLCKLSWKDLDPYYLIDPASIRVSRLIDTSEGNLFLDMCASPGGKSLVLLDKILKEPYSSELQSQLISNEVSFSRSKTLKNVFESFIPKDIRQKHLVVSNVDAKLWGLAEPNKYNSILLDVPCSGDRHLIKEKNEIKKWSLKSCKNLAKTQYGLLRSALETVKIGGEVVYVTCAMSEIENDQLIEQILKKRKGNVSIDTIALNVGERTEFGWQILPDTSPYYEGPLYVAKLRRIS